MKLAFRSAFGAEEKSDPKSEGSFSDDWLEPTEMTTTGLGGETEREREREREKEKREICINIGTAYSYDKYIIVLKGVIQTS